MSLMNRRASSGRPWPVRSAPLWPMAWKACTPQARWPKSQHPSGHLYATDPHHYYLEFMKLIGAARRFDHPGSVMVTELGAPDGGFYPWCTSDDMLPQHVIKAYTIATSLGIDLVTWYCFRDGSLNEQSKQPINSESFFGLLGPNDRWKPSAYAYRLFSRSCSNTTLRNDLVQVSGGCAARQMRSALYCKGQWRFHIDSLV